MANLNYLFNDNNIAMLILLSWLCILDVPVFVRSISVDIDGIIDLGPEWSYKYEIKPAKTSYSNEHELFTEFPDFLRGGKYKKTTPEFDPDSLITHYNMIEYKPKDIYDRPRAIKDDAKLNEFTYHVYKQSLKVFDEIKKKVDPTLGPSLDNIARSYDVKYREFVNETLNQKIRTRIGHERVVLNVIDTSNRLLNRLVNFFIADLNKKGTLRENTAATHVFQKIVDNECELEMRHACNKFGICRSSHGFSEFIVDILTIIVKSDATKNKQAADALTEVVKNTDFKNIMDEKTAKKFRQKIEEIEVLDGYMMKGMFLVVKNMFALKNHPFYTMVAESGYVNKTIAFIEMIHEMDKLLPANEQNVLEWTDMKNSLTEWSKDQRHDILEIMQRLISFLKKNVFDKLSGALAQNFSDKINLILA